MNASFLAGWLAGWLADYKVRSTCEYGVARLDTSSPRQIGNH